VKDGRLYVNGIVADYRYGESKWAVVLYPFFLAPIQNVVDVIRSKAYDRRAEMSFSSYHPGLWYILSMYGILIFVDRKLIGTKKAGFINTLRNVWFLIQ
jgi:hypothetical protein